MDQAALASLRASLEQARELIERCIGRLTEGEEVRALRWRCRRCNHLIHFTRPMPEHVAPPCPKCRGDSFECVR